MNRPGDDGTVVSVPGPGDGGTVVRVPGPGAIKVSRMEGRVVDDVTRRPRVIDSEDSGTVVSVPGPEEGKGRRVVDDVTRRPEDDGTVVSVPSPGDGRWSADLFGETTGSDVIGRVPLPSAPGGTVCSVEASRGSAVTGIRCGMRPVDEDGAWGLVERRSLDFANSSSWARPAILASYSCSRLSSC